MLYHVTAPLEDRFMSLEEAQIFAAYPPLYKPRVPYTRMPEEDDSIPRICLARSLEDCITGIGMHTFRRCVDQNPYEVSGEEVYPVLVSSFREEDLLVHMPTVNQVPDVDITGELWGLNEAFPFTTELIWFDMRSIRSQWDVCEEVVFHTKPPKWGNHPWLNGKGHVLDSSEKEDCKQECEAEARMS